MTAQILLNTQCDFDAKVRDAEEQLRRGQLVELHFKFRGREIADPKIGFEFVHQVLFRLATTGRTDRGSAGQGQAETCNAHNHSYPDSDRCTFQPDPIRDTVLWLRDRDIDIRCVRLRPYSDGGSRLIDVQQIIPLPEANDYQVQLREKEQKGRPKRAERYDVRERFWEGLISVARNRHTRHENIKPGPYQWLGASSGIRGLGLNYVIVQGSAGRGQAETCNSGRWICTGSRRGSSVESG